MKPFLDNHNCKYADDVFDQSAGHGHEQSLPFASMEECLVQIFHLGFCKAATPRRKTLLTLRNVQNLLFLALHASRAFSRQAHARYALIVLPIIGATAQFGQHSRGANFKPDDSLQSTDISSSAHDYLLHN